MFGITAEMWMDTHCFIFTSISWAGKKKREALVYLREGCGQPPLLTYLQTYGGLSASFPNTLTHNVCLPEVNEIETGISG